MNVLIPILAVLSIWDYPARQPRHEMLRNQFVIALRAGDTVTMEETCQKGVALLPDDPTWHFNLACALAYFPKRIDEALNELEKAIDLGFRDAEKIANDVDLKRMKDNPRFAALVEYAKMMRTRPMMTGPLATVDATGIFGSPIALGEQNLVWNFEIGCFEARLKLAAGRLDPWTGDLYVNRDGGHSQLPVASFPGLTEVKFDQDGRQRLLDRNAPNTLFPYPVFGNCSMAFVNTPYWRSIPRALLTKESRRLKSMEKFYLSNQFWVFPSNQDTAPVGTNGDVFASIAPYWLTTAGRSYSDRPYLAAALQASAALKKDVKQEIVRRRLLAPTLQTLIRKSLHAVAKDEDYLSFRAHPTAFPPNGVDTNRLTEAARRLTVGEIPPVVFVAAELQSPQTSPLWPELTYRSLCSWGYVFRAEDRVRSCVIRAAGAKEFRFFHSHGLDVEVNIEPIASNAVRVTIDRTKMTPVNRVDIAVVGRNPGTDWGAPSYVSFAFMDSSAPYSDPVLTPLANPKSESSSAQ